MEQQLEDAIIAVEDLKKDRAALTMLRATLKNIQKAIYELEQNIQRNNGGAFTADGPPQECMFNALDRAHSHGILCICPKCS